MGAVMKTHYEPQAGFDASGEWVWHFQLEARNLSSVAQLRKLIAEAFTSKDPTTGLFHWRSYTTGFGHETWRECEFDYFLIASDIAYRDMSEMFTWRDHGRQLADMMKVTDDPARRRTLKEASAAWHSPTMESLAQHAARLGWTSPTGLSVRAPAEAWAKVSKRARAYVRRDGLTNEELAQQQRKRHLKSQRADLDRMVDRVVKTLVQRVPQEAALRYVIDRLRERLPEVRKVESVARQQKWARDYATFKGNTAALAKHWDLTRDGAHRRIRTCRLGRRPSLQIKPTKKAS
jgi:hypothetical protein